VSKNRERPVTVTHLSSYQHVSNGGISFAFFTDAMPNGRKVSQLEVTISNHGVNHRTIVPVFVTTAPILRALADAIERAQVKDFEYLRGIVAEIETQDGVTTTYKNVDGKATVVEPDINGSGESGNSEQAG